MYKKLALILIITILLPLLSSCSSVEEIITGEKNAGVSYEEKDVVNLALCSIRTLNPVISDDKDTYFISKLIYQGLFKMDDALIPQNDLAKSYKISSSGKSMTVELAQSFFSDGKRVKASDVVFSVNAYRQAGNDTIYKGHVNSIVKAVAADKYTVKLSFSDRADIRKLTFPIIPKHKFSSVNELLNTIGKFRPLGSGPYRISSFRPDDEIRLKANKEYTGEKPSNTLVFSTYKANADILNLIDGNLVSFSVDTDMDRQKSLGSKNIESTEFVSNQVEYIGYNCRSGPTALKDVRKAISYAVDAERILSDCYFGSGILTDSLYYPGYYGTENSGDLYSLNRKTAEELLKNCGFSDINRDGYVEDENGKSISLKILVSNSSSRKKAAEVIRRNLEKVEISSQIVSPGSKEYERAVRKGQFDIYVGGAEFADYYDMTGYLGEGNFAGYINDELALKLTEEMSADAVNEIKTAAADDVPYYPLLAKTFSACCSNELKGDIKPMFNNYYSGCENWYSLYTIVEDRKQK